MGSPTASSSSVPVASATSSSPCSCCSSCTAAPIPSFESQTTLAALDELADAGYVGRHDAEQLADGVPLPAHGRAPAAARRRAAGPRGARPTRSSSTGWPASSATRARRARARPSCSSTSCATISPIAAGHPRAPVVPAAARGLRARRRSGAHRGGRGHSARRVRLHRCRTHAPGGARADTRPHALVAADAADAAAAARLALVVARPRPRTARPAQPRVRSAAIDGARHRVPRVATGRAAAVSPPRDEPDRSASCCAATPT